MSQFIAEVLSASTERLEQHSVFEHFEKAITQVSENVNAYLEAGGIESIKLEEEEDYLHQIDDVREELSMIKRTLLQQEDVWKEFASSTWPEYWTTGYMAIPAETMGQIPYAQRRVLNNIIQPQKLFAKYKRQMSQLEEDAERVRDQILTKLELKAKHAGIREAHSSAIMSAAVLGFTIITVIFTPLSFTVALFALPIKDLQNHQINSTWGDTEKPTGVYTRAYVATWTSRSMHLIRLRPADFGSRIWNCLYSGNRHFHASCYPLLHRWPHTPGPEQAKVSDEGRKHRFESIGSHKHC
jgi:hypothetical protein